MRQSLLISTIFCMVVSAQVPNALGLARQLANESTRQNAIAAIVASGNETVPLLLSLTKKPPAQLNQHALFVGLADAFGQLKAKEAIPFLIKNIGLDRELIREPNISMKTAEVIKGRMPAVAALIQIGPAASQALIGTWQKIDRDDELWAIFVVSQIRGVPKAREFLSSVLGEANMERSFAEDGLKAMDGEQ